MSGVKRPGLGLWQRLRACFGARYVRVRFFRGWRDDWRVVPVVRHEGQDCAAVSMSRYSTEVFDALTGHWAEIDRWVEYQPLATLPNDWEWLAGGPEA